MLDCGAIREFRQVGRLVFEVGSRQKAEMKKLHPDPPRRGAGSPAQERPPRHYIWFTPKHPILSFPLTRLWGFEGFIYHPPCEDFYYPLVRVNIPFKAPKPPRLNQSKLDPASSSGASHTSRRPSPAPTTLPEPSPKRPPCTEATSTTFAGVTRPATGSARQNAVLETSCLVIQ
jgi:hypothetical protein